jgi:hypothetical protein
MSKPALLLVLAIATALVSAQSVTTTRRATNVAALVGHPDFFHMRPVVLVGELKLLNTGEVTVTTDGASIRVVPQGNIPDGIAEVRGEFWDIGKFSAGDPRLQKYDLKRTFGIDPEGAWPKAGQVLALIMSSAQAATPPSAPSIRNVVLYPSRYLDEKVTVVGQFGGRNILGDLPDAPGQSRYDFVLRSADAAMWVTNLRPKGKDFDLALDSRIDTGRWLEVSGTLQQGRGLQWLNAEGGSVKITQAQKETSEQAVVRAVPAPPPEIVFSAPTAGETDVAPTTSIRIQFSRDMDPATFRGHVRVTSGERSVEFTSQYLPGNRVLELKFPAPLDRFSPIVIELQDGIVATDKQPLTAWMLKFQTG